MIYFYSFLTLLLQIHAGGGLYGFYYSTGSAELNFTSGFEGLVCPATYVDPGTPIPSICINTKRLYDSSGVYVKTGCRMGSYLNQTAASASCQSYGMQLYSAITAVDYDLLEQFAAVVFPNGGAALSVNGIKAANGSWFAYNPTAQPLYSAINAGGAPPVCLILTVGGGPKIGFAPVTCDTICNFFCEFY